MPTATGNAGTMLTSAERKELYLLVLSSNRCNIAEACAALGVSRSWFNKWMQLDPNFNSRVNDILEARVDFAESKLLQNVDGNSSSDIKFFLQTQAKHRGYGRETVLAGDLSRPIGIGAAVAVSGNIGLHVPYPKAPATIEEWEQQVADAKRARAQRLLEAEKDPEQVAQDMITRIKELEADEDCELERKLTHPRGGNGGSAAYGTPGYVRDGTLKPAEEQE